MLLGRPVRWVTRYVHDGDGRLDYAVSETEPWFLDEDVVDALGRVEARRGECPGCGLPTDEVWMPDADDLARLPEEAREAAVAEVREMRRAHRVRQRLCSVCEQAGDLPHEAGGHPVIVPQ